FLSVVLHGLLLTAQAATLGGIAFLLLLTEPMAREFGESGPVMRRRCARLLRWSAITGAVVAAATLAFQVSLLMATLDQSLGQSLSAAPAITGLVEVVSSGAIASSPAGPARPASSCWSRHSSCWLRPSPPPMPWHAPKTARCPCS